MSFKIANHAIRMVFANLEDVLKLTLVPYILITLIGMAISYVATGTLNWQGNGMTLELNDPDGLNSEALDTTAIFAGLVYLAIYLPLTAWLAVGWHRFVLAEEYPNGFMPRPQRGRIQPYIWRVVQLFFLALGCGIVIGIAIFGLSVLGTAAAVLGAFGLGVALVIVYTRVSIVLPAISIDRADFGIREAFAATEGFSAMIFGTLLIFSLYFLGAALLASAVAFVAPFLTISFEIILEWVSLVVGISFLTTLYGVIVEGRTLG